MLKIIILYRAYSHEKKQEYFLTIDELKELLYHITVTTVGYKAENAVLDEAYQTIIFGTEKEYWRTWNWMKTLKEKQKCTDNNHS